ncbi:hypothetical protein SH449x_002207 [Pirellulaceae bacterium SH449]
MTNGNLLPEIPGIRITNSRNIGLAIRFEFFIERDAIDVAIIGLLEALERFDEFALADHRKGDYEACSIFRATSAGFEMMTGGHGWSSEWHNLDHTAALIEMNRLAEYNHGPHWSNCGHLIARGA